MRASLAAAAAVALALVALAGCGDDASLPPPPPAGPDTIFRFSDFQAAPLVDGGEVTLASLRGKVVLFDVFGTWSASSRRTTPLVVSLYARYRAQGLEVVGLAYERTADPVQAREAVTAYRQEFSVPYVLALGPEVAREELRRKALARGEVPTLFVMDRQGVVRDLFEDLPPGHEAILADRIERLLAEPYVPVPGT